MFKALVVGTDGSNTAQAAVDHAAALAGTFRCPLHLVTGYVTPTATTGVDTPEALSYQMQAADLLDSVTARVAQMLDRIATPLRLAGLDVRVHSINKDPADALIDVATDENADLIVIGDKGLSGPTRFLMGSVPNKVTHHADCSVLVVKTS